MPLGKGSGKDVGFGGLAFRICESSASVRLAALKLRSELVGNLAAVYGSIRGADQPKEALWSGRFVEFIQRAECGVRRNACGWRARKRSGLGHFPQDANRAADTDKHSDDKNRNESLVGLRECADHTTVSGTPLFISSS